ncbi:MAG: hypothetical protein ACWGO1_09295 [Anaerolineales bacterium]
MKYQHLLPPLLIFGVFLLTGIWMGRWIGHTFEAEQLKTAGNRLPAMVDMHRPNPSGGYSGEHSNSPRLVPDQNAQDSDHHNRSLQKQTNVLLLGVDDLHSPDPVLESVWLILYLPDMPQITWMPIYPQILRTEMGVRLQANNALADTFTLENESEPGQDFLQLLKQDDIWWSHYVILDRSGAIELIDSLGGVEVASPLRSSEMVKVSGLQALSELRPANGDLYGALYSQATLIQQLCRIPPKSYLNLNRAQIIMQRLKDHLITDLTAEHVIDDLQLMIKSGGGFVCDFPSLNLLSSDK